MSAGSAAAAAHAAAALSCARAAPDSLKMPVPARCHRMLPTAAAAHGWRGTHAVLCADRCCHLHLAEHGEHACCQRWAAPALWPSRPDRCVLVQWYFMPGKGDAEPLLQVRSGRLAAARGCAVLCCAVCCPVQDCMPAQASDAGAQPAACRQACRWCALDAVAAPVAHLCRLRCAALRCAALPVHEPGCHTLAQATACTCAAGAPLRLPSGPPRRGGVRHVRAASCQGVPRRGVPLRLLAPPAPPVFWEAAQGPDQACSRSPNPGYSQVPAPASQVLLLEASRTWAQAPAHLVSLLCRPPKPLASAHAACPAARACAGLAAGLCLDGGAQAGAAGAPGGQCGGRARAAHPGGGAPLLCGDGYLSPPLQ